MRFHLNSFFSNIEHDNCIFVSANVEYIEQTNKIDLKQNCLKVDTVSFHSQKKYSQKKPYIGKF